MVSRIQQSLSFHDSPESFISSRLQQLSISDPDSLPASGSSTAIVRASILNRNVHIISSYKSCEAVLNGDVAQTSDSAGNGNDSSIISTTGDAHGDKPIFAAEPAYKQFMSAFFPGPNVLLQDGPLHRTNKERWKERMRDLVSESSGVEDMIRRLTLDRFIQPYLRSASASPRRRATTDLYDSMKSLSWDMLFGIFLGLDRHEEKSDFRRAQELQDDLLRGQFSLFPVPIRTPFWSSPRTRGLDAVKSLQCLLAERLVKLESAEVGARQDASACPFMQQSKGGNNQEGNRQSFDEDDMIAHLLVFTSSIANKGLASLLTAYLMNLFLWRDDAGNDISSLADLIRSQEDTTTKERMLRSILAETERLSPPVVGVMRRVKQGITLHQNTRGAGSEHETPEYAIENGHDAWLYLAGAGRDPGVFEEADVFRWDRFMSAEDGELSSGFAFGRGVKTCLGVDLVRQICLTVARSVLDSQLSFEGTVFDRGVRYWLGWEKGVPLEMIAKDLKQLPCQRPRRPVKVEAVVNK